MINPIADLENFFSQYTDYVSADKPDERKYVSMHELQRLDPLAYQKKFEEYIQAHIDKEKEKIPLHIRLRERYCTGEVPQQVSPVAFRRALKELDYYNHAKRAVAQAGPDSFDAFEFSLIFKIDDPVIKKLRSVAIDIDTVFRLAASY